MIIWIGFGLMISGIAPLIYIFHKSRKENGYY